MTKQVDFLILDEPTNGLDINGLIWLKEFIGELRNNGVSILLASHAIFDLQECITDYVVFQKGVISKQGKWGREQEEIQGYELIVDQAETDSLVSIISKKNVDVHQSENGVVFIDTKMSYKEICEYLYNNNIFPESVITIKKSLETVFLEATKETEA